MESYVFHLFILKQQFIMLFKFAHLQMYSAILFLSRRGFCLSHSATSFGSKGLLRMPFSVKNSMALLGVELKRSVASVTSCFCFFLSITSYMVGIIEETGILFGRTWFMGTG